MLNDESQLCSTCRQVVLCPIGSAVANKMQLRARPFHHCSQRVFFFFSSFGAAHQEIVPQAAVQDETPIPLGHLMFVICQREFTDYLHFICMIPSSKYESTCSYLKNRPQVHQTTIVKVGHWQAIDLQYKRLKHHSKCYSIMLYSWYWLKI